MNQPRRPQLPISFGPHLQKRILTDSVLDVLVQLLVLLDRRIRDGVLALSRRIVVARPDLYVVRKAQEFAG